MTSDFKANFYSNDIRYMLNATEVGRGEMEIQWTLEGNGTFVDLYTVKNSVPTSAIFFLVSLNNGGVLVNGGGSEINFAPLSANQSRAAAGAVRRCTCTSRAVIRDDQNLDHNAKAEYSVSLTAYPNFFWNFYVRSPVAHRDGPPTGQSTIYRFGQAFDLSGDSIGGGFAS